MEIKIEPIKHLNNTPPKFKNIIYPKPILPHIQAPYYCCCSIGMRGSGKTFAVVKMLLNAEQSGFLNIETGGRCAIRTILFSQTISGNPIFDTLKSLDEDDKYDDYSEAKLFEILEELKKDKQYTNEYIEYVRAYKKYEKMSEEQFYKWKDKESIILLMSRDFVHYSQLPTPKYPHGVIVNIILDDVLSNREAFTNRKSTILNKAILNGRHYSLNIIICSQNLKSITKCIRANTQVWILFKTKSKKILIDDLYQEISGVLTEDEFLELFDKATENDHDALVIDEKDCSENSIVFKRNFDEILYRPKKREK